MKIKVKKMHEDAKLPQSAYSSDAGYDLYAVSDGVVKDTYITYNTGVAIEPDKGFHTEIFPRSSISTTDLVLANSVGLIDNGYRNALEVRFKIIPRITTDKNGNPVVSNKIPTVYKKGDKIAQLVIRKTESVDFVEDDLQTSERGLNGFGSSGK